MKEHYGVEFEDDATVIDIHKWCYRNWVDNGEILPKWVHFKMFIQLLWPEVLPNGEKGLVWDPWFDRCIKSWCARDYQTWWGPSSSGKSTRAAAIAVAHWFSAPTQTTVTICSTTRNALEKRIWREVLRLHSLLGNDAIGHPRKQPARIVYEDKESESGVSTINGIFAVAIMTGDKSESVGGNLFGVHNTYNVLIADELQGLTDVIFDAWENLSTGKEAKFLGMGNPISRLDPLGRASEPKDGNWDAINPSLEEWETKSGWCLYFDGLKSPAIKDPEKYFFLLNAQQIENTAKSSGKDSQIFWSQRRGFVPPEGLMPTILSESFISRYHMREKAVWESGFQVGACMDPAFSEGGDKAIFIFFKYGRMVNGMMGIEFEPPIPLNFEVSATDDKGKPKPFFIALGDKAIDLLVQRNMHIGQFALDRTGSQMSLADYIDYRWSELYPDQSQYFCYRVNFSGSCSDKPRGPGDPRPCKDVFKNRAAELMFTFKEYVVNDQIRGVLDDALKQFCSRYEIVTPRGLLAVESKKEYKGRTGGDSPDESDAHLVGVDFVRNVKGIEPGAGDKVRAKARASSRPSWDEQVASASNMYLNDGIGADSYGVNSQNSRLTRREQSSIMRALFSDSEFN